MSVDSMAPEAFTHSELAQAMTWREKQPEYIQKMTGTPDSLMSFYKRFLRSKKAPHHASRDGQSFQASLKSLAQGLKSFDDNPEPLPTSEPLSTSSSEMPFQPTLGRDISFEESPTAPEIPVQQRPQPHPPSPQPPMTPKEEDHASTPEQLKTTATSFDPAPVQNTADLESHGLDIDSQKMIQEVKLRLNLSSDQEALRALVKIGYDKLIRTL